MSALCTPFPTKVEKPHFPYVRHVLCDTEAISHIANEAVRV